MSVTITNVRPLKSRKLIALFSIELPSGTVINSCLLAVSDDRRSYTVIPPRIPLVGQDGEILRDKGGAVMFQAAVSFRRTEARLRFTATALAALREQAAELFTTQGR